MLERWLMSYAFMILYYYYIDDELIHTTQPSGNKKNGVTQVQRRGWEFDLSCFGRISSKNCTLFSSFFLRRMETSC